MKTNKLICLMLFGLALYGRLKKNNKKALPDIPAALFILSKKWRGGFGGICHPKAQKNRKYSNKRDILCMKRRDDYDMDQRYAKGTAIY